MANLPYRYTIGLEVHVELATATKMFCRCANNPFGVEPNENTCPVCMALPGTLPIPNHEAIRKTIMVGKALGATTPKFSKFDRKHYFYPDSPKGYQISQYDLPFCLGGKLDVLGDDGDIDFTVTFERVHLEEDAGKLMHTGKDGYSKVDLNRAGVTLIEMVTEPVITNPEQARKFMQELRLLIKALGASDADMEKGQMRCDANVSIQFQENGVEVSSPITEIKNVNSTRGVERALTVEAQRQYDEWMAGGPIKERKNKITVGWDENTNSVQINRAKEAAKDYRYFPEPDIPPFEIYEIPELNPENISIPELPNEVRRRYLGLGIAMQDVQTMMDSPELLERLETLLKGGAVSPSRAAKWLINMPSLGLSAEHTERLIALTDEGILSASALKAQMTTFVEKLHSGDQSVESVLDAMGLLQRHDDSVVQSAIATVLAENPQAVTDFKEGKEKIIGFLVGQVMKRTAGASNPQKIQEALRAALAEA